MIWDTVEVRAEMVSNIRPVCQQPPILIINNDSDSTRERYLATSIESLETPYRIWRNADGAVPFVDGFSAIIYYTGNRTAETIPIADRQMFGRALHDGISLLVSGQNIAADLARTEFLGNVLHAQFLTDDTRSRQVLGKAGDELTDGMRMLLIGNQGAANQTSTDGISAVGNAVPCALYSDRGDTAAAVRWVEDSGARGIFCAFGVEAISGSGGTTSRALFLERALTWLGIDLEVEKEKPVGSPSTPHLISGYPNPFNSSIKLYFSEDFEGGKFGVSIWGIDGKLVTSIGGGVGGMLVWNGDDFAGIPVSAGTYFVRINSLSNSTSLPPALRITLVR
jgi:hypothetical protein